MARETKEFRNVNCKVEKTIADELEALVKETGQTKTAVVEKALTLYITRYKEIGKI